MLLRIINLPVFDDHSTWNDTRSTLISHEASLPIYQNIFPLFNVCTWSNDERQQHIRGTIFFSTDSLKRNLFAYLVRYLWVFNRCSKKKKMKSRFSKYFSRKKPKDIEKSTQLRLKYSCTTLTKHSWNVSWIRFFFGGEFITIR